MSASSDGILSREYDFKVGIKARSNDNLLVHSATNTRVDSCGRTLYGHNGGVWEWTSTSFDGLPGFETSEVYPGYSSDFFDNLHQVVVSPSQRLAV